MDFVESTVPLRAIKSAVDVQHSHANKALLDTLTNAGSSSQFLAADGQYHPLPEVFSVSAFLQHYNQTDGNVSAQTNEAGQLYFTATNHFADDLGGTVIGSIEIEQGSSNKQLNLSIAQVDVNSGAVSDSGIQYLAVGDGLTVSFADGVISLALNQSESPFTDHMQLQASATANHVAIFNSSGQAVDGGILLSALCTDEELAQHAADSSLHVTSELQAMWTNKQDALTPTQLLATNSGITAVKVSAYDAYATTKLNVGGHTPNQAVVTDEDGNITTEAKFDPATKINVVPSAVVNHVAIFTADGNVADSGVVLGSFGGKSVKDYIDDSVLNAVSGSSYQGTYTYLGTQDEIQSWDNLKSGDTAIAYAGEIDAITGLLLGTYSGSAWSFESFPQVLSNGAWFEFDYFLSNNPPASGRAIVRSDGISATQLDIRFDAGARLDDVTIALDSDGFTGFKMRRLGSGKSVLNNTTADNIAYAFTQDSGGIDNSTTVKEQIDYIRANYEPKFSKNTAFNKNFDTTHGGANSSAVIGNNDTRLSDARPASDVYSWAKAATKPTYTYDEVGALGAKETAVAATKLATARTIRVNLGATTAESFDGTGNVTPGVSGTLPISNGGTGLTTWTAGQVPVGNGTSAPSFRAITATPTNGSTALFTAGGAYTQLATKQNRIYWQKDTPSAVAGNYWFQSADDSPFTTIRYFNGTTWDYIYPTIEPTWKAQVDAMLENGVTPYVAVIGGSLSLTGANKLNWSGSAGNYSCTIAYSAHKKGKFTPTSTSYYAPKVYTIDLSSGSLTSGVVTYDSPEVNINTGAVTLRSNINTSLLVLIM